VNARRLILLFCLGTLSSAAAADPREVLLPGGGRVALTEPLCAALAAAPDADGAAYRPGIDAEGRPVAPADLPGAAPTVAPVEIFVDPRRFGAPSIPGVVPRGSLGYATVENGRALLDGRPLADDALERLRAACGSAR